MQNQSQQLQLFGSSAQAVVGSAAGADRSRLDSPRYPGECAADTGSAKISGGLGCRPGVHGGLATPAQADLCAGVDFHDTTGLPSAVSWASILDWFRAHHAALCDMIESGARVCVYPGSDSHFLHTP